MSYEKQKFCKVADWKDWVANISCSRYQFSKLQNMLYIYSYKYFAIFDIVLNTGENQ